MKTIIVNEKFNEKKLSNFLLSSVSGLSIATFYKLLRKKEIKINGKRIKQNVNVVTGDEIIIYFSDALLQKSPIFSVVYEDDNILIINKPANIAITGEENSLTQHLQKKYSFIFPCHRLDRNTSGLVLFAKNQEALDILLHKFKNHEIEKHYICISIGSLPKKKDCLTAYLFKDSKKSIVYISDVPKKGYSKIITGYRVIKYSKSNNLSLLDIHLKTGKTHQIRAHLAHIGNPILGDR